MKPKKNFIHIFDNSGNHPVYTAIVKNNVWSFLESATRAKVTINDNDTITFNWKWKHDGSDLLPLCNRLAKKIK